MNFMKNLSFMTVTSIMHSINSFLLPIDYFMGKTFKSLSTRLNILDYRLYYKIIKQIIDLNAF